MRAPLAALVFVLATAPVRADVILSADVAEYTPGQAFNVSVGLGPVTNLGLYNIELVLQTSGPLGDVLTVGPVLPAGSGYVFASPEFFLAAPNASGTEYRLALSDFVLDSPGPTVTPGVNDLITTFRVTTSATASGPIRLFVDGSASFLDDADGLPIPLSGTPSLTLGSTPSDPAAVPAPPTLVCGLTGLALLAYRRSRARARPAANRITSR